MARIFHDHVWDLIPEDSFYLRSTMKEQMALYGSKPGGIKYAFGMAPASRFETYTYPIWARLATNHPTISVSFQGSNTGDLSAIPSINIEKQINVAVPMFRFVGANMVAQKGEDRFAATYCDQSGKKLFANNKVTLNKLDVTFANPVTGELNPGQKTTQIVVNDGNIVTKYGEDNTYTTLANGTPLNNVVPMNNIDANRAAPVWDTATEKFISVRMSEDKAFNSTDRTMRTLIPTEKIVGISMVAIPTSNYFNDVISGDLAPINDLTYFDYWTLPTWIGTVPFFAGKISTLGLIAAGDILPGGVIYNELMRKRSYSYLSFVYDNEDKKYPVKRTMIGVGPFGELQIGSDSYVPVSTNGDGTFTKNTTTFTPSTTAGGTAGEIFTSFTPADFNDRTLIYTSIATGKSGESTLNTINGTSIVTASTADNTFVPNDKVSACIKVSSKKIVGTLDDVLPATRAELAATHNTGINVIQGFDKTVLSLSAHVYEIYKNIGRKLTGLTVDGVTMDIDFANGTKTVNGVNTQYGVDEFMVDLANQGLIGSAIIRVDVHSTFNVAK